MLSRIDFARLACRLLSLDHSLLIPLTTPELNQRAARPLIAGLDSTLLTTTLGRPFFRTPEQGILDWQETLANPVFGFTCGYPSASLMCKMRYQPRGLTSKWRWILIVIALCGSTLYGFVFGRAYSDLHPVWTSTRAAIHRADPYSSELVDQERIRFHAEVPGNSADEQRFAYPFPAIFLFAPLAPLPFDQARILFTAFGVLLRFAQSSGGQASCDGPSSCWRSRPVLSC